MPATAPLGPAVMLSPAPAFAQLAAGAHTVPRRAHPSPMGLTAARFVPVSMVHPVTLSMDNAIVPLAGWDPPACRPVPLACMARTVSIPVFAATEGAVTPSWASARAQRAGPVWPVRVSAFRDTMEPAVSSAAVALTGAHVTGSQATASAQLAGLGTSVRAPVPRTSLGFTVRSAVPAGEVPPATTSRGPASVPQDGGAHAARVPVQVAGLERPVPSVATAHPVPPATT